MIEKKAYIVTHVDSDTASDKREVNTAADIVNLEVTNNQGMASLSPVRDRIPYSSEVVGKILGYCELNTMLYFISKDLISHQVSLKSMDFSTGSIENLTSAGLAINYADDAILDMIIIKETEDIIKVYWCGGGEQLCSMNVLRGAGMDVYDPRVVKPQQLYTPVVTDTLVGGALKAGVVQYAYSQFELHGNETVISGLSLPSAVSIDMLGGASKEIMNLSKEVSFTIADYTKYDWIRVFSIHYQELDQLPKITLIYEAKILSSDFKIIDDGNLFLAEYSLDSFLFIGGKVIHGTTIAQKNNRLFLGNYNQTFFDLPSPYDVNFDCRVYQYNAAGTAAVIKMTDGSNAISVGMDYSIVPETHDCVNSDPNLYLYKKGTAVVGATGPNFELSVVSTTPTDVNDFRKIKSLKQGETYRIGMVLTDEFMRETPVKWMCDIKIPRYDDYPLIGISVRYYGTIFLWDTAGVKGYKIVIAQRKERDRTVSSQGVVIPGTQWSHYVSYELGFPYFTPFPQVKRILNSAAVNLGGDISTFIKAGIDYSARTTVDTIYPSLRDDICFVYSSDSIFEGNLSSPYSSLYISRMGSDTDDGSTSKSKTVIKIWKNGSIFDSSSYGYIKYNGFSANISIYPNIMFNEVGYEAANIYQFEITHVHKYTVIDSTEAKTVTLLNPAVYMDKNSYLMIDSLGISSFVNIAPFVAIGSTNPEPANYASQNASCFVFKADFNWHKSITNVGWGAYVDKASLIANQVRMPIVELLRTLPNQYGGNSYGVKQNTTYLLNGEFKPLDGLTNIYYIGDVTIGPLIVNLSDGLDTKQDNYWNVYQYVILDYVENNVDVYSRYDTLYARIGSSYIPESTLFNAYRIDDNHKLLGAYNQANNIRVAYGTPATFSVVSNYPTSIITTEVKISNEVVDSWSRFLPNESLNLQGTYGSLIKLYNFKNELYAFQEKATAQLLIEPKIQIQASSDTGVELGTGSILYNYQYINTLSGTIAPFSIVTDGNLLFYYDHITNTINAITGEEISKTRTFQTIMNSHIPSNPQMVTGAYSNVRNEFYWYCKDTLIVYNTLLQKFQRRDTVEDSDFYFGFRGVLFSKNSLNSSIYLQYGSNIKKPGTITYNFAPDPMYDKVFHNIEYRSRGSLVITSILVNTAGGLTALSTTVEGEDRVKGFEKFRIKRVHLPRIYNSRDRIRDTHILVTLTLQDLSVDSSRSYLDDLVLMYNIKG